MGQEAQGPPRAECVLDWSHSYIIVEQKEDKSLDEYTMAANAKIKAAGLFILPLVTFHSNSPPIPQALRTRKRPSVGTRM
jgi:hypothetical protein